MRQTTFLPPDAEHLNAELLPYAEIKASASPFLCLES